MSLLDIASSVLSAIGVKPAHHISESLDRVQRVFIASGVKPPRITLIDDFGKKTEIVNYKENEIGEYDIKWASEALYEFARNAELILKKHPALITNFIKDGGKFFLANNPVEFETSEYTPDYTYYPDKPEGQRIGYDRSFEVVLRLDDLRKREENVAAHELAHHLDVPETEEDGRHSVYSMFTTCFNWDGILRGDASLAHEIKTLLPERNYEEFRHREHFSVVAEKICSENPPYSPLLSAYMQVVDLDMDYQLSKSSYVLDRDVDVMKRMLKNFDFSEPTKDLMSDLFLLRVKAESPETDAVAAKVFWQQSYKLEDELESEMVSEILDFVREVRAEFNLPKIDVTTEDMLMGRQPQQAR